VVAADAAGRRGARRRALLRLLAARTLATFAVVAGIFLLLDGALAVASAIFGHGEGRGIIAIVGILSVIAGLVLIKHPFDTLVVFTLIVGVWFVVAGIARLISAFSTSEGRGGNIAIALVDVLAGAVILAWPDLGLATVAVIIGIVLILRGILFIVAGWGLRKFGEDLSEKYGETGAVA